MSSVEAGVAADAPTLGEAAERGAGSVAGIVTLIPGAGVVIRTDSYVGVFGENAIPLLDQIREIERTVAVPDRSVHRGRHVVRALAELVENAGEQIAVAFAAPDDVGIAVYLHGAVYAEIDGGRREPFGDVPFDRGIPWPLEGLGLYLAATVPDEPGEERFNLIAGEVPAAGLLLHTPAGLHGADEYSTGRHSAHASSAEDASAEDASQETSNAESSNAELPNTESSNVATSGTDTYTADEDIVAAESDSEQLGAAGEVDAPTENYPAPPADEPHTHADTPEGMGSVATDPFSSPRVRSQSDQQQRPRPSWLGDGAQSDPQVPASQVLVDAATDSIKGAPPPAAPRHASTLPPNPAFQVDSLQEPSGESRPPLPKQERQGPAMEVGNVSDSRVFVRGIRCSRGHLNHPRSWLCGVCGIRVDQVGGVLVEGERPPLGWLLMDNGATYLLDDNLVLGREPGTSGGARTGTPKPIRVLDESSQLSRRHIELRLVDWEVHLIDLGSANGTFVMDPNYGNREMQVPPHQPIPLAPGAHVRIGGRHFLFESPHARA